MGGEGIGPSEHGGDRIARISPRRSSENYISPSGKYPPGKLHFSFTPSPTDTRNTSADFW